MPKFADSLESILVTLWVGGLWAIGYLAAPVLFANLPDRMLAGALAGRLFAGIAWVGLGCGIALLALRALRLRAALLSDRQAWLAGAMLALTLAGHFGVQPVLQALKDEVAPASVMESRPSSPPFSPTLIPDPSPTGGREVRDSPSPSGRGGRGEGSEKGGSSLLSPSGREVGREGSREAFGRWHGVSSGVYLAQSLLGLALVVLRGRRLS